MARGCLKIAHVFLFIASHAFIMNCFAQVQENQPNPPLVAAKGNFAPTEAGDRRDWLVEHPNTLGLPLARNMLIDQKAIWTSPAHIHWEDGAWLFPLAAASAGLFASDRSAVKSLSSDSSKASRYISISNDGLYALVGAGGGLYLLGRISHDDHRSEAGILAGEAVVDSLGVATAFKYSFGRERPYQSLHGPFFSGGDSFPSSHSAVAWSIASVIAHEYPGALTQFFAYGMAAAVSASRVMGQQHFPSDVVVGGALGWLIGREVYHLRHDPELAGVAAEPLSNTEDDEHRREPQHMGSPFVPLDSWVYPAFERLAALGYVRTATMGLKPWTRMECARLTEEASETLRDNQTLNPQAVGLQERVAKEFAYELNLLGGGHNLTANVESIYARTVSISGPALTDGYHFGQTISYDFGRPFERGTNGQAGGSFSAAAGPLTTYVRAEYQHAPSAPAFSIAARTFIAAGDDVPPFEVPSGVTAVINRPELLDAYAAINLSNWELVVGRQSISWAPGPDSMMWSDNASAADLVRVVNSEPLYLPGFLRHLGPVRLDNLFGRLGSNPQVVTPFARGYTYVSRPFVYGQKINVKPFPFLELGFGRRTMLGGEGGDPLTVRSFVRSYFGLTDPRLGSVPGDTESEMDWTFYVPKTRNYIVLYGDAYAEDDFLPIQNPARNPWHPGLFISRIPGIPKLDFHIEGVSTEQQGTFRSNTNLGKFNYWNETYHEGNTNDGFLMGNTVGRDGRQILCWTTYSFSSREMLQFIYEHNTVAADFMPRGAAWQDYTLRSEVYLRSGLYVKSKLQYENITRYPLLYARPQKNVSATIEVGFLPERKN
jgi:membrane-associated phospholipid phosphatase